MNDSRPATPVARAIGLEPRHASSWRLWLYATAVIVAFATSIAFWGDRLLADGPPTGVDAVATAEFAPSPEDVPDFMMVRSGTSAHPFFVRTDGLGAEIRRRIVLDSELRAFVRLDYSATLSVEIVSARYDGGAGFFLSAPADLPRVDGLEGVPSNAESFMGVSESTARTDIVLPEGGLAVHISSQASGDDAAESSRRMAVDALEMVTSKWTQPTPLLDADSHGLTLRRFALIGAMDQIILSIMIVGLLALFASITDRGTRRLMWNIVRRPRSQVDASWTADVRIEARRIRRQHRASVTVSAAVLMALWFGSLAAGLELAGQVLVVLAGFLAHAWLSQRLQITPLRTGSPPSTIRGRWRVCGWVLAAVSIVVLIAGVGALSAARATSWMGPIGGASDLQTDAVVDVLTVVGFVVLGLAYLPLFVSRLVAARQFSRHAANDPRPPALLLRSFAEDGMIVRSRGAGGASAIDRLLLRRRERFEELAARCLTVGGPLRALSDPGSRLPRLGAVREEVADDQWEARITSLIDSSRLVAVFLARTEFCVQELRHLQHRGGLDRAIFIVPPVDQDERRRRLNILCSTLSISMAAVDWESAGDAVLAVIVHPDLGALALTSDACDDVSYQLALVHAQALLRKRFDRSILFSRRPRRGALQPVRWDGPGVWAPGRAPRRKPWYRRLWAWAIIALLLSWLVRMCSVVADPPASEVQFIEFDERVRSLATAPSSESLYAVTASGALFEIDPDRGSSTSVGTFGEFVSEIVVGERAIAGISKATDRAFVLDPSSQEGWHVALDSTPGSAALIDDRLVVSLPAESTLAVFDARDGNELRRRVLEGRPVDLAVHRGELLVTQPDRDQMVAVDPTDLGVLRQVPMEGAPLYVSSSGDLLWTQMVEGGEVKVWDDDLRDGTTLARPTIVWPEFDRDRTAFPAAQVGTDVLVQFASDLNDCRIKLQGRPSSWLTLSDQRLLVTYFNTPYIFVYDECG